MPGRSPESPSALTLNSDRAASEKCGWVSLHHLRWTHTLSPSLGAKQPDAVRLLRNGFSLVVPLKYETYVTDFHPTRLFNIITQTVCLAVIIFWVIFISIFSPFGLVVFFRGGSSQSSASTYLYSLRPLSHDMKLAPANFMSYLPKSPPRSLLSSLYNIDCLRRIQSSQSDFISKTSIIPVPLMSSIQVPSILITLPSTVPLGSLCHYL